MELQNRKIVIIGAGHVGSHAGYALLSQGLAEEIVYIDVDRDKAKAQALDLADATNYLPSRAKVWAGSYSDAADAQLLIVAAGPLPDMSKGQTRMDTLRQTIAIMKDVTEGIRMSGFAGIILNISNPADVVTHYIQHRLNWPPRRILSTSTTLDSARLRRAIAEATGVDQKSISAYALGEHGESQMVAWSAVTIGGKPLSQLQAERPDTYGSLDLQALADEGRRGGWVILGGKGSTEFGIGASIAEVVRAIFHDENRVLPVSVRLDGAYGWQDVYASVPALLNRNGVADIIELQLTPTEQAQFDASCKTMNENYQLSLTL
ncbi:MAG: L-lactate dehydrogenase [Agathobaculum sp.]|uniref:L-lactate dehydrogenase n=1 Tax=Agathobaculum sp. TaxID=2048138 RepID=UPI002A836BBE|nr:L-lactate dehydrogenase [Agathobaculum sp.]MDY3711270.1 L-lactate dehydrogenase [Agathobaculum sp.]